MINGHGGNIYKIANELKCKPFDIMDMSSNLNPLGPMPGLLEFIKNNLYVTTKLPEVDCHGPVKSFCNYYGIDSENVIAGNGTTQFIYTIPLALNIKRACILGPTYSDYADACKMFNIPYEYVLANEKNSFIHNFNSLSNLIKDFDTIFICNPNNPTGSSISKKNLMELCQSNPQKKFIIDESYLPFTTIESMMDSKLPNVVILNSMSKIFSIPGLRIGFIIAQPKIIKKFQNYYQPWSVNSMAQAVISFIMDQQKKINDFIKKTIDYIEIEKDKLFDKLRHIDGIDIYSSETPFFLIKLKDINAEEICQYLISKTMLIRNCSNFEGLSHNYIRVSLKSQQVNNLFVENMTVFLSLLKRR